MKRRSIALTGALLALVAAAAFAAPMQKMAHKVTGPTTYQCSKCHMKFTAAAAKKDKYLDPMDGGKLIAVKPMKPMPKHMTGMSM